MTGKFPESLHFVGIGGIGMSGLAQLARSLGWRVTGSDRALDKPENAQIFQALRAQGIELFPQDGSRFAAPDLPGGLVYCSAYYSTATVEDPIPVKSNDSSENGYGVCLVSLHVCIVDGIGSTDSAGICMLNSNNAGPVGGKFLENVERAVCIVDVIV